MAAPRSVATCCALSRHIRTTCAPHSDILNRTLVTHLLCISYRISCLINYLSSTCSASTQLSHQHLISISSRVRLSEQRAADGTWATVVLDCPGGGACAGRATTVPAARMVYTLPANAAGVYRAVVCVTNIAGITGCVASAGFLYDTTAPTAGKLCIGLKCGCNGAYNESSPYENGGPDWSNDDLTTCRWSTMHAATQQVAVPTRGPPLILSWSGFADAESGVRQFEWCVGGPFASAKLGQQKRACEAVGWLTEVELPLALLVKHAMLDQGNLAVYLWVRCTNGVGLVTKAAIRVLFDASPPEIEMRNGALAITGVGAPLGGVRYGSSATVSVCWDTNEFFDFHSGVASAAVTLRSPLQAATTVWQAARAAFSGKECANVSVAQYTHYVATLAVVNGVGIRSQGTVTFSIDPRTATNGQVYACDGSHRRVLAFGNAEDVALCYVRFTGAAGGVASHAVELRRDQCPPSSGMLAPMRCPDVPLVELKVWEGTLTHADRVPLSLNVITCGYNYTLLSTATTATGVSLPTLTVYFTVDCSAPIGGWIHFTRGWGEEHAAAADQLRSPVWSHGASQSIWHTDTAIQMVEALCIPADRKVYASLGAASPSQLPKLAGTLRCCPRVVPSRPLARSPARTPAHTPGPQLPANVLAILPRRLSRRRVGRGRDATQRRRWCIHIHRHSHARPHRRQPSDARPNAQRGAVRPSVRCACRISVSICPYTQRCHSTRGVQPLRLGAHTNAQVGARACNRAGACGVPVVASLLACRSPPTAGIITLYPVIDTLVHVLVYVLIHVLPTAM